MTRILLHLAALLRDEGIMSVALGAALALSVIGVATGAAQLAVGPFRDWSVIAVPALALLFVVAVVAVARPRTGA